MAIARRGRDVVAGCVVHADRGSQFRSRRYVAALHRHGLRGSMGRVACLLTGQSDPWGVAA